MGPEQGLGIGAQLRLFEAECQVRETLPIVRRFVLVRATGTHSQKVSKQCIISQKPANS
jgi:hypothetical protein